MFFHQRIFQLKTNLHAISKITIESSSSRNNLSNNPYDLQNELRSQNPMK